MKTRKTAEMGVRPQETKPRCCKGGKRIKGEKEMLARVTESTLVFPPTPFCHRSESPTAAAADVVA